MINADKPFLWKEDISASVDLFNQWFINFAPKAYRNTRKKTADSVIQAIEHTDFLRNITIECLKNNPNILKILRMTTAPPLARDRLVGLSDSNKNLVYRMEEENRLPIRMNPNIIDDHLERIMNTIIDLIDIDIFEWISEERDPTEVESDRASTIIADRLCGAVANPIIRNAQENRQLDLIKVFLENKGYRYEEHLSGKPIKSIDPGIFTFRMNVPVGDRLSINIPIDVLIQPKKVKSNKLPFLIEAKSAGDFTNVNKRRKEEAIKIRQLRQSYGKDIQMILFLCGYFDAGYLGYEAAEGLDWVWEHRIEDLNALGL